MDGLVVHRKSPHISHYWRRVLILGETGSISSRPVALWESLKAQPIVQKQTLRRLTSTIGLYGRCERVDFSGRCEPNEVNVCPAGVCHCGEHFRPPAAVGADDPMHEGVFRVPEGQMRPKPFHVVAVYKFLRSPAPPRAPQHPPHEQRRRQVQPDYRVESLPERRLRKSRVVAGGHPGISLRRPLDPARQLTRVRFVEADPTGKPVERVEFHELRIERCRQTLRERALAGGGVPDHMHPAADRRGRRARLPGWPRPAILQALARPLPDRGQ